MVQNAGMHKITQITIGCGARRGRTSQGSELRFSTLEMLQNPSIVEICWFSKIPVPKKNSQTLWYFVDLHFLTSERTDSFRKFSPYVTHHFLISERIDCIARNPRSDFSRSRQPPHWRESPVCDEVPTLERTQQRGHFCKLGGRGLVCATSLVVGTPAAPRRFASENHRKFKKQENLFRANLK